MGPEHKYREVRQRPLSRRYVSVGGRIVQPAPQLSSTQKNTVFTENPVETPDLNPGGKDN